MRFDYALDLTVEESEEWLDAAIALEKEKANG